MRYIVNDLCIGCGLCAAACPEVFELTDKGFAKAIDEEIDGSLEPGADEAMEGCPVAAIEKD